MTKIVNGYVSHLNSVVPGRTLNLKYFNIVLLATMAVLGVFYLVNISNLTAQGFILHDLKNQEASLAGANLANQQAVDDAQSYYSLSTRVQQLNMVAVGDVEYLSANRHIVAER